MKETYIIINTFQGFTRTEIIIKQSEQAALIGGSLDVTCEVSGVNSSDQTITWAKLGQSDLGDNVINRGGTMRFV